MLAQYLFSQTIDTTLSVKTIFYLTLFSIFKKSKFKRLNYFDIIFR